MISLFDLCWQFGQPDPAELIGSMSEPQLRRWLIYVGRVRDEERRADARAAAIIAAIFETQRNKKQRARAYTARDFIPTYPDAAPPATAPAAPVAAPGQPPVRVRLATPRGAVRPVPTANESAARLIEQFRRIGARPHADGRRNPRDQIDP